jgi:hypothetical protein
MARPTASFLVVTLLAVLGWAPTLRAEVLVGSKADAATLAQDPLLKKPIIKNWKQPKVEEILETLVESTGLEITVHQSVPRDRIAFGSFSVHNVPAWKVMEQFANAVTVNGSWIKEENGYRLVGARKPLPRSLVKNSPAKLPCAPNPPGPLPVTSKASAPGPPPESSPAELGSFLLLFGIANFVVVLGVLAAWHFWNKRSSDVDTEDR